ncbi:unnamed protein product [Caenorhabditis bovis]|uniref:C2H2-type domain-containing protein n=1 Tax=Caenorhabditis bovis TaxID=2654633 RepID=A0A8S1F7D4_9PELO|nr:unnamed protein product [Caenorhabditis bovis]
MSSSSPPMQNDKEFAVPNCGENAVDMSLSDNERRCRTRFYKKIEEMRRNNQIVMECSRCLLIFTDVIIYRFHSIMHSSTFQCTMCHTQCTDRRNFLQHSIECAHSMIPPSIADPSTITFSNGLPNLPSPINE